MITLNKFSEIEKKEISHIVGLEKVNRHIYVFSGYCKFKVSFLFSLVNS